MDGEEFLGWVADRLAEHIATVADLESAGQRGEQFILGNGLARLRQMLELNLRAVRDRMAP